MHKVFEYLMGVYLFILSSVSELATGLATLANHEVGQSDYTLAAIVASSVILGIICSVWAVITHIRSSGFRQSMRAALSRAQADIRFREAMITACPEAIAILGSDIGAPLSYRGGAGLLQACLD